MRARVASRVAFLVGGLALVATPASAMTPTEGGMSATADVTTRTYASSSANLANPERGFYHHTETHYRADGSGYVPLDAARLRAWREEEKITQILRVFYLEKFVDTDRIDPGYLDLLRADFATARAAGEGDRALRVRPAQGRLALPATLRRRA